MALTPWKNRRQSMIDKYRDDFDELMDSFFPGIMERPVFMPKIDIREDEKNIYIDTDIPGMDKENINAYVRGGALVISADQKREREDNKENYHHAERYKGRLYREIGLPGGVDTGQIRADYKNGVLHLTLPKREKEEAGPHRISIE